MLSNHAHPGAINLDSHGPLIIVSNRGPVEHSIDGTGHIVRSKAGGGVAVALSAAARHESFTWIAGACNFADRVVALTGQRIGLGGGSALRLLSVPEDMHAPFYQTFCNPLLWFVQHSLGNELQRQNLAAEATAAWQTGYVPVNRLFAETVVEEIDASGGNARVMLNDYHLYVAPRYIREARPAVTLQHFVHIPWPAPLDWYALPSRLVRQICDGLLANDAVVFQTDNDVVNFLATCRAFLGPEAAVSERLGEVEYRDQVTHVWSNPISIDDQELNELAASAEVEAHTRELQARGRASIVRVDRLDPSKNVLRGFQAYELLLERNQSLHGRLDFHAYLVPSRKGIAEYDGYAERVFQQVERINRRFGREDWTPVTLHYEQNRARAIAGLRTYDVLLVNSVADGMNLVSKEGAFLNQRAGVLVLSVTAGSYAELADGAIGIDPYDVAGTAQALEEALKMGAKERASMAQRLRCAVERHLLEDWIRHQVRNLSVLQYVKRTQQVGYNGAKFRAG